MMIEALDLYFNSFKDYYNTEKDALAEGIREQNRRHATLAKLEQYSGPEFAAIKKILETQKESNTELNAKFLLMTEVIDHKFQITQKKMEGIKDLVHETEDDQKKAIEAVELSINSLKGHLKFKMDAQADKLTEQCRIVDGTLDFLKNTGPEYSAAKKQFETMKETGSELKAGLLLFNEKDELKWESIQELFKDLDETEDDPRCLAHPGDVCVSCTCDGGIVQAIPFKGIFPLVWEANPLKASQVSHGTFRERSYVISFCCGRHVRKRKRNQQWSDYL
ncbi:unnamed protein product [Arctogadus glacialis]